MQFVHELPTAYDRNGLAGVPYVEVVCDLQPVFVAFSIETRCCAALLGPLFKRFGCDIARALIRRSVSEKFISGLGSREAEQSLPAGHVHVAQFVHDGVIAQRLLLWHSFELMNYGYGSIGTEINPVLPDREGSHVEANVKSMHLRSDRQCVQGL
jgi:hypothetical protein